MLLLLTLSSVAPTHYLCMFLALTAAVGNSAGENETVAASVETAGYESRAGAVLGTWRPVSSLAGEYCACGNPFVTSQWALQLDGHHDALNITLDGEAWSMSPSFIGTLSKRFSVAGTKM